MAGQRPTRPSTVQQLSTGTLVNLDQATVSRLLSELADAVANLERRVGVSAASASDALFTATAAGDVAASGAPTGRFLRDDNTFQAIPGGGDVLHTRAINTSSPLTGGGDLSADRTIAVNTFGAAQPGVVPSSGGGTTNFLRADGSWQAPAGAVASVSAGSSKVTASPTTGAVVVDVVPANFTGIPESAVTNLVADLAARSTPQQDWIAVSLRL